MDSTSKPTPDPVEAVFMELNQPATSASPAEQGDESTSQQDEGSVTTHSNQPSAPVESMDSMDTVAIELEKAVAEPSATVKNGYAPAPFMFGFEPSAKYPDQRQAFSQLLGMSGITRMFAAINTVSARGARKQTEPYSLHVPKEYVAAFNEGTEATIKALTIGPLAGFYDSTMGGSTQTEELLLKRSELHPLVLRQIFSGLSPVTAKHLDDLDDVLTDFVAMLKPYQCTPTADQSTLKHVILINYIRATDISGGGSMFVIDAFTRMVSLTLKAEEWSVALRKPGILKRNEKIKFSITTTIAEMKLDGGKYQANKEKYEQALEMMIGDQADLKKIIKKGGLEAFGRETSIVLPPQEDTETLEE
ncbi:hypothetical protein EDB81DRAFT_758574 [Dactylonectria macrodidyma]|uniref:Uncharacterized protein n=1 Tax=Dactylonectria macrodidyma TaxID=307937 RepID=A0A9P9F6E1_9HYPO|nr:hypothetical protein EDB81DRAFT_758574 [Dactylonectria macrodidyma]